MWLYFYFPDEVYDLRHFKRDDMSGEENTRKLLERVDAVHELCWSNPRCQDVGRVQVLGKREKERTGWLDPLRVQAHPEERDGVRNEKYDRGEKKKALFVIDDQHQNKRCMVLKNMLLIVFSCLFFLLRFVTDVHPPTDNISWSPRMHVRMRNLLCPEKK